MNKSSYFVVALEIILACSIALNVYFYSQGQSVAPNSAQIAFAKEFGDAVVISPSLNFSPPTSMYKALGIALKSDGWNATSLVNMTITVSLDYREFTNTSDSFGFQLVRHVTQPEASYADEHVNDTTTFRYVWDITVNPSQGVSFPPWGFYYVDAQTGDIIPHGIIY